MIELNEQMIIRWVIQWRMRPEYRRRRADRVVASDGKWRVECSGTFDEIPNPSALVHRKNQLDDECEYRLIREHRLGRSVLTIFS